MKFLSVCSGIEAASVAWEPLGWSPVLYSEIEKFPRAVLEDRQKAIDASKSGASANGVPLWGDFTAIRARHFDRLGITLPDLLVGGTPCQAFSVAGLRRSLDDARGNLSLSFVRLANAIDNERSRRKLPPQVIIWENVPGVLSTKDNAFGCFLGALAGSDAPLVPPGGGKWSNAGLVNGPRRSVAWRVLDAQHFGVPQRRRRVFVVASARNLFDPGAVLFELDGLQGDTKKGREKRQDITGTIEASIDRRRGCGMNPSQLTVHHTTGAGFWQEGFGTLRAREQDSHENLVAGTLLNNGKAAGSATQQDAENGLLIPTNDNFANLPRITGAITARFGGSAMGAPEVDANLYIPWKREVAHTLRGEGFDASEDGTGRGTPLVPVAFHAQQDPITADDVSLLIGTGGGTGQASIGVILPKSAVRRLTPRECERLQGFPDDYTMIPWGRSKGKAKPREACPDGPRYKALGNSMAVPVMRWIGKRIDQLIYWRFE